MATSNSSNPAAGSNNKDAWSSNKYDKNASFVPALGAPVVALLDPQSHERILDLGAGDGVLTVELEKKCESVVAIDSSSNMIDAAKSIGCKDARVVDGHDLVDHEIANGQFDAVFSNAALHWMKKDPARVVQGVHKSLKTGGRFVAEMGGHMNVSEVRGCVHAALKRRGVNPDDVDPWYFPGVNSYTRLLQENGFHVEYIELIPRLTKLNTNIEGWLDTFGFSFFKPFEGNDEEKKAIMREVQDDLKSSEDDGAWYIMYVRLRFKAIKVE